MLNNVADLGLSVFFRQLVDRWQDGVLLLDEAFSICYTNGTFQNMVQGGLNSLSDSLLGLTVHEAFNEPLANQLLEQAAGVLKASDDHWLSDHIVIADEQGMERHFSLQALPVTDGDTTRVAICLKNISALIRHEIRGNELQLELEQNSLRDEMTGLSSRAYWESWLSSEFNRSKRYQQDLSIILIDLATHQGSLSELPAEAFVNVIADVSRIMLSVLRNSDQAARYSDKRVAALLPHTNGVGAENLAVRLSEKIAHYIKDEDLESWIEFRIGVAVFHGASLEGDDSPKMERYDDLLQRVEDDLLS